MDYNRLLSIASWRPNWLADTPSWIGHMPFAYWLMQEIKPSMMVELGTHTGNSYFSFCQSVLDFNLNTYCYAVDTWKGDAHSGEYGEEVFTMVSEHNHKYPFSTLMRTTFDEAATHFTSGSIDVLHIDGLHTYEAVKHDFTTWLPKMSKKWLVLLHDTQVKHADFGVWKLWEELRHQCPNAEFTHCNGLGVLGDYHWLGDKMLLLTYFRSLGINLMNAYELARRGK